MVISPLVLALVTGDTLPDVQPQVGLIQQSPLTSDRDRDMNPCQQHLKFSSSLPRKDCQAGNKNGLLAHSNILFRPKNISFWVAFVPFGPNHFWAKFNSICNWFNFLSSLLSKIEDDSHPTQSDIVATIPHTFAHSHLFQSHMHTHIHTHAHAHTRIQAFALTYTLPCTHTHPHY